MRCLWILVLTFLLLSGCGSSDDCMNIALDLRNTLNNASQCSFQCSITADYSDRQYTFSMDCVADKAGNVRFVVTKPESICNIEGQIDSVGGNLTFDGFVLAFPLLADGYLSPVSTPWLFIKTLRSGYILSSAQYEDGIRITVNDSYDEKALQLDIWLNQQNIPYFCEVNWDGLRILSMEVSAFTCV